MFVYSNNMGNVYVARATSVLLWHIVVNGAVDMYSTNSVDTPKNFCGIYTGQFCIRGMYLMVNKFKIKVDRSADVLYNIFILSNKGFNFINTFSPGGGIGRHKGLKIPRWKQHDGSSPSPGTIQQQQYNDSIAQQDRATAF